MPAIASVPARLGRHLLGACRALGGESEKWPQRAQFLPDLQPNSRAIGQKAGEKWAAAAILQPPIPKPGRLLGAGLLSGALLLAGCAVGPMVPVYPGDGAIVAQPYTTYDTYGTYAPYGYGYGAQPVYPAVVPPPVVWIGGTWRSGPDYRRPPGPPPHWGSRPGPGWGGRPGPGPGPGWHRPPQGGPGPGRGPGHAGPPPPGDRPALPGSRGGGR